MLPKPILFVDFDGTLCTDRYWRSLPPEKFAQIQKLLFENSNGSPMIQDWLRGKHAAEDVNHFLSEQIGISFEELWPLFVKDCQTMSVPKELLEKMARVREKYVVIVATGNFDSFTRFTVPALHLDSYVDHISNSYYNGKLKGDGGGAIFEEHAEAAGIDLKECVLLDDSKNTCDLFEKLGGKAYLITPEFDAAYYLERLA
jgi:FMN phosphatase YigB (HAD superfamily)